MRNDIESLINSEKDFNIETRDELDGRIVATDFFQCMANDIDKFEISRRESKRGYSTPSFPTFEKRLEGWSPGFYAFAGPPNAGKTAIMLNIADDLCKYEENKLFGVYFSLDDNKTDVIPRLVAMNECIPINIVSKPRVFEQKIIDGDINSLLIQGQLDKAEEGLRKIKENSNKMMVCDSLEIKTIDDIYEKARQIHSYVKSIDEEMNIVILVDSLKDIALGEGYGKMTTNEKIDVVSKKLKDLSNELDCILFASMHLRKLNANRRPTMDDLKDSNTLEYELNVCFLVSNDVSRNAQSAKIFYRRDTEDPEKLPVLEINWGKNKLSSYKGLTFCNFATEFSKCVECGKEATDRYTALVYEM